MEKYLITINLDSCILNKNKKFPFLTSLFLSRLIENGHLIIFSSKYSIEDNYEYLKKFKLFNYPFIAFNGAEIAYINCKKERTHSISFSLDYKLINDFLYQNKGMNFIFEIDKSYSSKDITKHMFNNNILSLILKIDKSEKNNWIKIFKKYKFNYYEISSDELNSEYCIISSNARKEYCIELLRKKYFIKKDHIICFGKDECDQNLLVNFNSYLLNDSKLDLQIERISEDKNGVINVLRKRYGYLFD